MKRILSIYKKQKLAIMLACLFVSLAVAEYTSASMLACICLVQFGEQILEQKSNHTGHSDE